MASTVKQIIAVICPDLSADSGLDVYIELAANKTSSCFFGDNYNHAVALRACHMFSLSKRGSSGGTGPVSGKKEGDLQINYSNEGSNKSNSQLSSTQYGQELLQLIREGQPGISVTGDQNINGLSVCDAAE